MGIFFTYKAVNDSAVFNKDAYKNYIKKLLGRHVYRVVDIKEIALIDVDKGGLVERLNNLDNLCEKIQNKYSNRIQGFFTYWRKGFNKALIDELRSNLESFVEYAQYSKSRLVVLKLMDYPIIRNLLLYYPCKNKKVGTLVAMVLPLSIPIYLIGLHEQKLLKREFAAIRKTNKEIMTIIENEYKEE